jgi:hypothetical protein
MQIFIGMLGIVRRMRSIQADIVIDVLSNKPFSFSATDVASYLFNRLVYGQDFRAARGTSHNDLLVDESIISRVASSLRF